MDVLDPYLNPYIRYDDLRDPFYYSEDDFFKKKEKPSHHQNWASNDAILDEVFEEAERFAKVSPYAKKGVPDAIEKVTLQIFAHFYELANRTGREEGEDWDAILSGHSPSPKKHSFSKSSRFYQYESNFSDDSCLDTIQSENGLQNLLNAVSEIFLGMRFDDTQARKTPYEMEYTLKNDQVQWKSLRNSYSDYFQLKMDKVFQIARDLLKERIQDDESALRHRITFYAGAIIATVGLLLSQRVIFVSGIAFSLAMSCYMIVHYATSSLGRMQQESNLKLSIDNIYYEAAKYRLNLANTDSFEDLIFE